ncbi:hypothetical protein [Virgibacillus proomii]|uniref:hypothetical protein n=1 Tax=Virgibacillus proomii TaxID=84407 RepID=UPI000986CE3E|nr:hypothetical protein [Virgibacillus proomii]
MENKEMFEIIISKLGSLKEGQNTLKMENKSLRVGQDELRHEFKSFQTGQDELHNKTNLLSQEVIDLRDETKSLRVGQDELRHEFKSFQTGQDELCNKTNLFSQEVIDLRDETKSLRVDMNQGFTTLNEKIELLTKQTSNVIIKHHQHELIYLKEKVSSLEEDNVYG